MKHIPRSNLVTQLIAMVFTCMAWAVLAEDSHQPVINQIVEIDQQLTKYLKISEPLKGEQKLLLKLRVSRLVDEQKLLMTEYIEEGDAVTNMSPKQVETAKGIFSRQLHLATQFNETLNKQVNDLRAENHQLEGEKLLAQEEQMSEVQKRVDHITVFRLDLIQWLERLGSDVKKPTRAFEQALYERADNVSLLLNYSHSRLSELITAKSSALESEVSPLDASIKAFQIKRDSCNTSLELLINTMDSIGANTSSYKETLIASTGSVTEDIFNFAVMSRLVSRWFTHMGQWLFEHGPDFTFKLILFGAIIIAFRFIAGLVRRLVVKATNASKLNLSRLLQDFFASIAHKLVMLFGFLVALGQIGIEVAPLLAGFGVAGIVIGFALQGTLSNFASGLMILIYRPFDVDDVVVAGGITGTVEKLSLVNATIKTFDNQRIIVPNNKIWDDIITNVTAERIRRVDLIFGIGYSDDIAKAEKAIHEVLEAHDLVLPHPEPIVKVANLGESSVDFWVRPWVKTANYWNVYWDITRQVKMKFDEEGVSIPFPQRDVHVHMPESVPLELTDPESPSGSKESSR
ncbi:mechanosensitive ion channel family protein [Echinimonas agarilytica]|uniref:Small-conductance mechanosensitive channel n=1 Tax=Echinimonas agarilytica TaxID=1215918 RepID=A0AA41W8M6_9GAMM|nr:mechanosensitive ion channel family protein [Echinimonas agarilytica]MCM2680492.1 mechanosensitive ion channel family protein [Echinimonas agarilytica]